MRIGTWNVEYAKPSRNPDRLTWLKNKDADIWVLTETHRDLDLSETHVPFCSEPRPILHKGKVTAGSSWVTIWSRKNHFPLVRKFKVPDDLRMVGAIFDSPTGPIAVAGVVLPWHSDKGDAPIGPVPRHWDEFRRVIRDELPTLLKEMLEDVGGRRRVIAGDFNSVLAMPYKYPYPYPTLELRRGLLKVLTDENFSIHTADAMMPNAPIPRTLIDHVCTDFGKAKSSDVWSGSDGKSPRLSDHPGVVVELAE